MIIKAPKTDHDLEVEYDQALREGVRKWIGGRGILNYDDPRMRDRFARILVEEGGLPALGRQLVSLPDEGYAVPATYLRFVGAVLLAAGNRKGGG